MGACVLCSLVARGRSVGGPGVWDSRGPAPERGETGLLLLSSPKQRDRTLLLLVGLESR